MSSSLHFPLHTIGYEGTDVAQLIRALLAAGVTQLIDVRAVPNSRKKGFSKHVLARHLAEHGIGYVHLKALGTPRPGRDAARAGDAEGLHRIFGEHMEMPEAQLALQEAAERVRAAPSCLLCYEADPGMCHRTIVAEMLAARTGLPIRALAVPA